MRWRIELIGDNGQVREIWETEKSIDGLDVLLPTILPADKDSRGNETELIGFYFRPRVMRPGPVEPSYVVDRDFPP